MSRHSVFGVQLESDFPLPCLSQAGTGDLPVWRIQTRRAEPRVWNSAPIGAECVQGDVVVRAYRTEGAFRLTFDDTGTFDVRVGDRTIVWYPGPNANHAAVLADLLGRVIALAAHAEGRFTLHASAVSIAGEAVAFLGPKHAGKSTMALALVRAGARLLADDAVVVRLDAAAGAWASVGVQRPRLWSDSAEALRVGRGATDGDKPTIDLPPEGLEGNEVPLRACYVLNPIVPDAVAPVRRDRLAPVIASLSMVQFAKLAALLGGSEAPVVLERAAALAEVVPTYRVDVARDFGQLGGVAATLLEWHGAGGPPNVPRRR